MHESRLLPSAAIAILIAVVAIFTFDEPLARWLATRETYPAFWDTAIHYLEYPLGIEPYKWTGVWILVCGSIVTLAIARLRSYAFAFTLVTLVHLIGWNAMNWLKLAFGRWRPSQWLAKGGDVQMFWNDNAWSFPSGHAILFASVCVPIAVVYPRARPLLAIVVFAMTARVMVNAHFVSDVLAGYAFVAATTWGCVQLLRRALPSETRPASLR